MPLFIHRPTTAPFVNGAELDMKNYADRGDFSASVDNSLRNLHNSSYHTKAEFRLLSKLSPVSRHYN